MLPAQPPQVLPLPVPITLSKLLLVEGRTPMHFFEALLRHMGLAPQIEIRDYGGIKELPLFLTTLAATPQFPLVTSLGVIRDAEASAADARRSVDDGLRIAGLTAAKNPLIKTKVFILPDNTNPGMIETLCIDVVRNEPTLADPFGCVEDFFTCLRRRSVPLPADFRLAKHQAQAFLATRQDVQLYPGVAAYRGCWPWDNPIFDSLKRFLQSL